MRAACFEPSRPKAIRRPCTHEIVQHELRLHADPTRVVVRPFHLAWQASGPDLVRVQRLARDITSLDMHTVRSELAAVLRDFADRHWQIEKGLEERYVEIEPKIGRAQVWTTVNTAQHICRHLLEKKKKK